MGAGKEEVVYTYLAALAEEVLLCLRPSSVVRPLLSIQALPGLCHARTLISQHRPQTTYIVSETISTRRC